MKGELFPEDIKKKYPAGVSWEDITSDGVELENPIV